MPRPRSGANPLKLVILGCGGFIGSHLLDALFDHSDACVVGYDPSDAKIARHLTNDRFVFHRRTLQNSSFDSLEGEVRDADAVINLAAICNPSQYNTRPLDVIYTNLLHGYRVVECCSHHGTWLIHFSTSEVYGRTLASYLPDNDGDYRNPDLYELREDSTPLVMGPIANQRWTYACAKQLFERFVYAHHRECDLPFNIIRPFNFFGPRMDFLPGRDGEGVPRVLACFMTALLDGTPMQLVDGGAARRTILSIHDGVRAVVNLLERRERAINQIFNVGSRDNEVSMRELAERMRDLYARVTGDATYEDHPIVDVTARDFYGEGYEDCDRRMPDLAKAERLLDWTPRVSLDETLLETLEYYHRQFGDAATPGSA